MERTSINQRVGKAIHQALKRKGLTQEQLARQIGTTQRSISAYVRGEQQPSLETLVMICLRLELNLNQILHLSEVSFPDRLITKEDEQKLLLIYDEIPKEKKERFIAAMEAMKELLK